jgi:hypothetical protein
LNAIMPMVVENLGRYGEFAPVGLALNNSGKIELVMVHDEHAPDTNALIAQIRRGFVAGAREGRYRATALAYDSLVAPPGNDRKADAIAVAIDQRGGSSALYYFPYHRDQGGVQVDQKRAFGQRGDGGIFAAE